MANAPFEVLEAGWKHLPKTTTQEAITEMSGFTKDITEALNDRFHVIPGVGGTPEQVRTVVSESYDLFLRKPPGSPLVTAYDRLGMRAI